MKQCHPGFFKSTREKVSHADPHERVCPPLAPVEARGVFGNALSRDQVARPIASASPPLPTTGTARIESQGAVEEGDADIDVFAEVSEREASTTEDIRIITGNLKCPPSEIHASPAALLGVIGPTIDVEIVMAPRRVRQGRAVAGITLDRLLQQFEFRMIASFSQEKERARARGYRSWR